MKQTVDLFCGAGGITEGFRQAGFRCLYANDANEWATKTFNLNHPNTRIDNRPIEKVDASEIRKDLKLERGELDVLVGGPPCQGFSINAPERFLDDPRNALFRHSVRFIKEFLPQTFLLENVPGMLSMNDGKIFNQILKEFTRLGYSCTYKILFAAHYGVPQQRWRLIVLGSRQEPAPQHPYPTHFATGRANFRGGKELTFRLLELEQVTLKPFVTVQDAIGDLPKLRLGEGSEEVEYDRKATSEYAQFIRNRGRKTFNHFASKLSPQNIERLKYIAPGGSWRDIPHDLLPAGMQKARRSDHTKRYGRLCNDGLSGTIMTKCDPHWGSVYLPDQDRALTVREAARLQSFPDTYRFLGSRAAQYEQVGNAVPVLMAKAIAEVLSEYLDAERTQVKAG